MAHAGLCVIVCVLQALLCLHQPEIIELWNPEAPINTFWDVRSVSPATASSPRVKLEKNHAICLAPCYPQLPHMDFFTLNPLCPLLSRSTQVQFCMILTPCLPPQLPGAVLHLAEVDPASDPKLHGDPQVAARDPDLPQQLPAEAQGLRQRGQQHPHLSPGPHQTGGTYTHESVQKYARGLADSQTYINSRAGLAARDGQ